MRYKQIILLFLTIFTVILSGCQSPQLYTQTTDNVADASQQAKDAMRKSDDDAKKSPTMVVNQGLYVDQTPRVLSRDPSWLSRPIILRGDQLPFAYYSRTILSNTGKTVLVRYQSDLDSSILTSMNYSGTIRGALDTLAARSGYVYSVNGNSVGWQAYVTKTFDIAFMPGTSDYVLGDTGGGSTATSGSGGSSGGSSGGGVSGGMGGTSEYSNLKGTISVWKDLDVTIRALLSPQGKVIVSQSNTSVTVRDKAANVSLVSKYIENLNKNLSKQVLVKVQVLQIDLNSSFNYGINWGMVQSAFGGSNAILNANYGTPVSIATLTGAAIPTVGLQPMPDRATSFTLLVNALKQQGRVAVVSEPRVVCLNNQVSVVNIVDKVGYAASVSSTALAGGSGSSAAGGSSVTSSITPGTIVTGLVLYILPKILNDKVFLQVNADLSTLVKIDKFTSGEGGTSPASIQVPRTTEKEFNQRSVIASGDTLILSGFRQVQNTTGAMQFFESQALGGKGASQNNSETIVLITPIILNGSA